MNLSQDVQWLIQAQNDQILKFLFLFFTLGLAGYYLFYHKKFVEKPTPFFSIGISRLITTIFCYIFIISAPLALLLLDPAITFISLYSPFLWIYLTFVLIVVAVMAVDVIYFAPQIMIKWAGIDPNDPKVNKVNSFLNKFGKQ